MMAAVATAITTAQVASFCKDNHFALKIKVSGLCNQWDFSLFFAKRGLDAGATNAGVILEFNRHLIEQV
jgi:hypothetical protein